MEGSDVSAAPTEERSGRGRQTETKAAPTTAASDETSPLAILKGCEAAMFLDCFRAWPPEDKREASEKPERMSVERGDAASDTAVRAPDRITTPARNGRSVVAPAPGSQALEPELQTLLKQVEDLGLDYELPSRYAKP